ncbi:MAG TPA: tyrosine-protein phosphatase, partial [Polyangiaceae bacterium]|nr:tyrosine-protein phosphatase [Polyangiaceae bacterium]
MSRSSYCVLISALAFALAGCSSDAWFPASEAAGQGARAIAKPSIVESATGEGGAATAAAAGGAGAATDAGSPQPGAATECEPNQAVLTSEMSNARDLGGTPLTDGRHVACGAVYRGPPLRLSDSGCAEASRLGLRTLIDLRVDGERSSSPDAACVDAERVFAPLPIPYGVSPTDYLNDLHETPSIAAIFHAFGDPSAYPIYFHCTYGRDRTGIVGALLLLALGASREVVMQEYLLSQPNVGAYPDSLNAVL